MGGILAGAYVTVLLAEMVGDKSLYSVGALATRFRIAALFAGLAVAYLAKMGVAVLLARAITGLPPELLRVVTVATFLSLAVMIWRQRDTNLSVIDATGGNWRAASAGFASVFFTEWGDIGQLATATLAARHDAPLLVWMGASAAVITKAALVLTIGAGVRRVVPARTVRYAALCICVTMGVLAALHVEL